LSKHDAVRRLLDAHLLLLLDGDQGTEEAARDAMAAGVGAVEVPANEGVAAVVQAGLDLVVVAGTVTTAVQAWDAVETGAHAVSAVPLDAEIAAVCEAADVVMIAVASDTAQVTSALALHPDFLRVPAELAAAVATDTPVIVDVRVSPLPVRCSPSPRGPWTRALPRNYGCGCWRWSVRQRARPNQVDDTAVIVRSEPHIGNLPAAQTLAAERSGCGRQRKATSSRTGPRHQ